MNLPTGKLGPDAPGCSSGGSIDVGHLALASGRSRCKPLGSGTPSSGNGIRAALPVMPWVREPLRGKSDGKMLVGWKVGVLVFKVEGDIRYIYIYHLYIYIYVSLMIIHISCFFKTAYPFAIFSWLPKRLGKKLSVWRRAKKGRRRLGNERSPNRSFLVGPLFHHLWETVWNWGQTRWEGIQKKWQRQQSTTKGAFCKFPVDLHRDLQTIFGILPSDRTQLQCNCTGAESCTVRKNLARCCCWSCWWTSSWPLFGCVFDICALQDDCRWWMVNGWTMMIVSFRAVWLFFVYIC